MKYPVAVSGFEGQTIEVEASTLGAPKLLVDGQPAEKGPKRGQFLLRRNDGSEVVASWKPSFGSFGSVPPLAVGDDVVNVVEPLQWYEVVWSALPVSLVAIGGFIGAIVGMIAFLANSKIFRSAQSTAVKFLITGVITAVSFGVYFVIALMVASLFA